MNIICSSKRSRIICKEKDRSSFGQPNNEQNSHLHYDKPLFTQGAWQKCLTCAFSFFGQPFLFYNSIKVKIMKYRLMLPSWDSKFLETGILKFLSLSSRPGVANSHSSSLIWAALYFINKVLSAQATPIRVFSVTAFCTRMAEVSCGRPQ